MKKIDDQIRNTQAFWGVDKETATSLVQFVAMQQLITDDAELLWDKMHEAYPGLFAPRQIKCMACEVVIKFWPTDGTIAVRDDGELICLDCHSEN